MRRHWISAAFSFLLPVCGVFAALVPIFKLCSVTKGIAAAIIIGLIVSCFRSFFLAATFSVLCTLVFAGVIVVGQYEALGGVIDMNVLAAVMQADPPEAISFTIEYLFTGKAHLLSLLLCIGTIFTPAVIPLLAGKKEIISSSKRLKILRVLAFISAVSIGCFWLSSTPQTKTIIAALKKFGQQTQTMRAMEEKIRNHSLEVKGELKNINVAVVILESISRHYLGIYGYPFDTTPDLSSRIKDIIIANDAVSPHAHTAPCVVQALTAANAEMGRSSQEFGGISAISILRNLGAETLWLSSQNYFGFYENPVSIIANGAKKRMFFRTLSGSTRNSWGDKKLFSTFHRLLPNLSSPSLTVLHMYTGHSPYCGKIAAEYSEYPPYPADALGKSFFGNFTDYSRNLRCYNSNIVYIQKEIGGVIDALKQRPDPWLLLVFSDHGEAVTRKLGHNSVKPTAEHVEIPFFVFFNKTAQRVLSRNYKAMQHNRSKPFITSQIFESVLDLFGIGEVNGMRMKKSSIFSPSYRPNAHRKLFMLAKDDLVRAWDHMKDGSYLNYDDIQNSAQKDSYMLVRDSMALLRAKKPKLAPKIWAHRVNSIGKLLEAVKLFNGIELDVVFKDGRFIVGHPPDDYEGLSLKTFLEVQRQASSDCKLWVDWKNASQDNMDAATKVLHDLDRRFSLRSRAIVEVLAKPSTAIAVSRLLHQSGFKSSYYIPTAMVHRCRNKPEFCSKLSGHLANVVSNGGFDHLSFEYSGDRIYEIVSSFGLPLLTWDLSANLEGKQDLRKRADKWRRYGVILVPFPCPFNR